MAFMCICKTLPLLGEIIPLYLFKRVADDLGGLPLRRQVLQMLQSHSSTWITVFFILKVMHVPLLIYPSLNAPLKMTIYPCIT